MSVSSAQPVAPSAIVDVDTYTQNNVAHISRIPDQFKQDAGNFLVANKHVIWPFEARV